MKVSQWLAINKNGIVKVRKVVKSWREYLMLELKAKYKEEN